MARFVFYLVHGTQLYRRRKPRVDWIEDGSFFRRRLAKELGGEHDVEFRTVPWSGRNRHVHRLEAAIEIRKKIGKGRCASGERRFLVGHSHGGNACLLALKRFPALKIDGVICLSTPFLVLWKAPWATRMMVACLAAWFVVACLAAFRLLEGHLGGIVLAVAFMLIIALLATKVVGLVDSRSAEKWSLPEVPDRPVLIVRCPGDEASGALGSVQLLARLVFTLEGKIARFWSWVKDHPILSWLICGALLTSLGLAAAFSELGQIFVQEQIGRVGWIAGTLLIAPLLFGVPLRILIYMLSFGCDLGLMVLRYSISAEATPFGEWRLWMVPPRPGEVGPALAHSEPYSHPAVVEKVAAWVLEARVDPSTGCLPANGTRARSPE